MKKLINTLSILAVTVSPIVLSVSCSKKTPPQESPELPDEEVETIDWIQRQTEINEVFVQSYTTNFKPQRYNDFDYTPINGSDAFETYFTYSSNGKIATFNVSLSISFENIFNTPELTMEDFLVRYAQTIEQTISHEHSKYFAQADKILMNFKYRMNDSYNPLDSTKYVQKELLNIELINNANENTNLNKISQYVNYVSEEFDPSLVNHSLVIDDETNLLKGTFKSTNSNTTVPFPKLSLNLITFNERKFESIGDSIVVVPQVPDVPEEPEGPGDEDPLPVDIDAKRLEFNTWGKEKYQTYFEPARYNRPNSSDPKDKDRIVLGTNNSDSQKIPEQSYFFYTPDGRKAVFYIGLELTGQIHKAGNEQYTMEDMNSRVLIMLNDFILNKRSLYEFTNEIVIVTKHRYADPLIDSTDAGRNFIEKNLESVFINTSSILNGSLNVEEKFIEIMNTLGQSNPPLEISFDNGRSYKQKVLTETMEFHYGAIASKFWNDVDLDGYPDLREGSVKVNSTLFNERLAVNKQNLGGNNV